MVGAAPSDAQLPPTSAIAACDAHNPHQVFDHTADGQLTLRSDKTLCLTAGPKANNAGVRSPTPRVVSELSPCRSQVTLVKCAAGSATQMWSFEHSAPHGPAPPPPPEPKSAEWGQSFGPLNLKLQQA